MLTPSMSVTCLFVCLNGFFTAYQRNMAINARIRVLFYVKPKTSLDVDAVFDVMPKTLCVCRCMCGTGERDGV